MCFLFCMPYGEKSDSILEQLFEIDSMNVSKMQNRKVFFSPLRVCTESSHICACAKDISYGNQSANGNMYVKQKDHGKCTIYEENRNQVSSKQRHK